MRQREAGGDPAPEPEVDALRRTALNVVTMLPSTRSEAQKVLDYAREVVDRFFVPAGDGE